VVDRLGGVWIDVDHRYYNRNVHTLDTNFASINLRPGYQRLKGRQALDYVRFRHTDSDFHRNARQQAFVKALKEQVATSVSLTDLPGLINRITSNIEVGRGGGREISPLEVLRYARFAFGLPPGHFFQPKIDNITASSDGGRLYASDRDLQNAVSEFVHPDVDSPQKAEDAILPGKRGKGPHVRPRDITVSVLNGNRVPGSAADARAQLKERGFRTVEPDNPLAANAPEQKWHTTIYYDPARKLAQAGAQRLQAAFGDADIVRGIPAPLKPLALNAMTVAVVGKTFHNLTPVPIDRTPKKEPPVVRRDPNATRAMLRKAQRRVPFRLEVPWVIERYSNPDRTMPLRVYSMEKHKSVRLVFQMQDGWDYWGIEQTDWDDAPVLRQPSSTRFIKHRRFDLYFSGSHIHQIVLRENGATFWVVNSLMNDLSNTTMLAIATGLRPLKKLR
jgi:hypothetical protein